MLILFNRCCVGTMSCMALYQSVFMSSGTGFPCRLPHTDAQSVVAHRREMPMTGSSGVCRIECNHGGVKATPICFARFRPLMRVNVGSIHRELAHVLNVSRYPLHLGRVGARCLKFPLPKPIRRQSSWDVTLCL
jgi:hypothetical protein